MDKQKSYVHCYAVAVCLIFSVAVYSSPQPHSIKDIVQSAVLSVAASVPVKQNNDSAIQGPFAKVTPNQRIVSVPKSDKLSFYFQRIDVRSLLQLIAKNSKLNFIISSVVTGDISIDLKEVTWQQALDIVLKTQGLTSRQVGNILYISTVEQITGNELKQFDSMQKLSTLAPLRSHLVHLNYANATDLATLLKGSMLLSARGQAGVDPRTNSLLLSDTQHNLEQILPEIKKLDIPARQVLIEARIVNIDTLYEAQLGVRFGVTKAPHLTGTLLGANNMVSGTPPANVDVNQRLNFNLPAAALSSGGVPASIGLALAKVGTFLLDLELSAIEGERHGQVISRPRVVTSNQQKAVIETGEEIPYQEATSSGATAISFKNAFLRLEIVPQITPDNRIILNMRANQDTRGENVTVATVGGVNSTIPSINSQMVQSSVLLNNNETVVVGGVYKTITGNTIERIPFLGALPIIGNLFSHKGVTSEKHELLIFITPKIVVMNPNHPLEVRANRKVRVEIPRQGEG